jgi:hypothetical protein
LTNLKKNKTIKKNPKKAGGNVIVANAKKQLTTKSRNTKKPTHKPGNKTIKKFDRR